MLLLGRLKTLLSANGIGFARVCVKSNSEWKNRLLIDTGLVQVTLTPLVLYCHYLLSSLLLVIRLKFKFIQSFFYFVVLQT